MHNLRLLFGLQIVCKSGIQEMLFLEVNLCVNTELICVAVMLPSTKCLIYLVRFLVRQGRSLPVGLSTGPSVGRSHGTSQF